MKNKLQKLTILVIALTVITLMLVSSTFAKYTTEVDVNDTAVVAKFDVSAGNLSTTFDIFGVSKIYDTNGVTSYTAAGTDDTDVDNGTTDGIIAPGTWGKFAFTITNNSEVTVKYSATYDVDEKGVYLQWSTDGSTWVDDLNANVTPTTIASNATQDVTLYCRWVFEAETTPIAAGQSDANDTTLGVNAVTSAIRPTIDATISFTQVD